MHTLPTDMINNCGIAILCGIAIGIINDIIHSFTELTLYFPKKVRLLREILHDILLLCCYCTTFVLLLYYCNNGEFRIIFLIALLSGVYVYRLTLRKIVLKMLSVIELVINRLFLFPLQKLLFFVTFILKKTISIFTHPIAKMRSRMYNKLRKNNGGEK